MNIKLTNAILKIAEVSLKKATVLKSFDQKIFRWVEKDIDDVATTYRVDVYANNSAQLPFKISGTYIGAFCAYAYVNEDFLTNPITDNIVLMEDAVTYSETEASFSKTIETAESTAPYLAVCCRYSDVSDPISLYTTR